jgi:single-stranded DNA-binding protein
VNIVILSGRLTADPDIRMGTNDTKIARYILAVERRVKKNTERKSDFITCVCLGKNAEFSEILFCCLNIITIETMSTVKSNPPCIIIVTIV